LQEVPSDCLEREASAFSEGFFVGFMACGFLAFLWLQSFAAKCGHVDQFWGRFECQPSILEIVDVTTGFEQFFGPRSGRDLFSPAYLYVYIYIKVTLKMRVFNSLD
jgi:hypothetical protein